MSKRRQDLFQKQWDLISELQRHPRGISRQRLMEATGLPSTTLHRCITELREYGVPIATRTCSGETWHSVDAVELPALTITAPQLLALRFARRMLSPLEGTQITREIDGLLDSHKTRDGESAGISLPAPKVGAPDIVEVLERAIQQRRRVRIRVRTRDKPKPHDRLLDPLCLRCAAGVMYFVGFDHSRGEPRRFKVARISSVQKLVDKSAEHPDFDADEYFKDAIKVGSGEPIDVRIRFSERVAKLVPEQQPLPGQSLTDNADGSVTLHARVGGIHEVMRYALGWGQDAEVLEPAALREAMTLELENAARQYASPLAKRQKPRTIARARDQVFPRIVDRG